MNTPAPASKPPLTSMPPTARETQRPVSAATPGQAPGSFDSPDGRTYSDPPFACSSVAVLDGEAFACGGTPGHAGKHRYLIEWDRQGAIAAQEPHAAPGDAPGLLDPLHALAAKWDANAARNQRNGQSLIDQGDEYGNEGLAVAEALGACVVDLRAVLADAQPAPQPAPGLAAAMRETRQLRTALRTLADLWDASSDKDEETAARPNRARLILEERATTRRGCAADIRKLAGPPS